MGREGASNLLWVHPESLETQLDAATWLEMARALDKMGWLVTLVGEGPEGERNVSGVPVHCIKKEGVYPAGWILFHLRLLRFIWDRLPSLDVIMFHQLSAPWVLLLRQMQRISRSQGPHYIMDTRDLNPIESGLRNRGRRLYFSFAHRIANVWSDGQTAITTRMAELVRIPPRQRLGTWPSGVVIERFSPAGRERQWPQEGEPIRLIYVGKLHAERNLLPLCQAVEKANQRGCQFSLTLIGAGAQQTVLEEVAIGSNDQIRVLPPVPHDQIPLRLAEAHVGVTSLPDPNDVKFQASSPVKLFEYMASSMPVLATSNVCHTDVIGNEDYAFWVETPDVGALTVVLDEIWSRWSHLPKMGQKAAIAAEHWTWEQSAAKLAGALEAGLAHDGSVSSALRRA